MTAPSAGEGRPHDATRRAVLEEVADLPARIAAAGEDLRAGRLGFARRMGHCGFHVAGDLMRHVPEHQRHRRRLPLQ